MTKRVMVRFAICALLLTSFGAVRTASATPRSDELAGVPRISQADFKRELTAGNVLVLDVRDAASYESGHIPGAVSMPLDELGRHLEELKAEKRPIVTYCA